MTKHISKIEKLITELCPKGVKFNALGKVAKIKNGKDWKRLGEGNIPVYGTGGVMGYVDTFAYDKPTVLIPRKGSITNIFYLDEPFWNVDTIYYTEIDTTQIVPKFFYYVIKNIDLKKLDTGSGRPSLTQAILNKIKIPLPPLAIQQEIVKILDKFTELEAELEARKKQYNHYYKKLLLEGNNSKYITLNEIGKVSMCKRIFKNETKSSGDIPFYKIGTFGKEPNAFISQETYDEYRAKFSFPKKGDVLLSASGTIGRRVVYDGQPAYFQDSNIIWIDNHERKVLNKYLYYLYATVEWKTEGGTIQRLYNDNLKKIKIPVPPLLSLTNLHPKMERLTILLVPLQNF